MPEPHQKPKITPSMQKQIDDNLKRVYADTASEPLPDKFLALLSALKASEGGAKNDD